MLNDLIARAVVAARVPVSKEPVGWYAKTARDHAKFGETVRAHVRVRRIAGEIYPSLFAFPGHSRS